MIKKSGREINRLIFLKRTGQVSLQLLVFATITVMMIGGFALWAGTFLNISMHEFNKTAAFSIAESGIEYYRWHLAHNPDDYTDGTGEPGPYEHDYYDRSGNVIGAFSLNIIPPETGSSVVTIESIGKVAADSNIQKTIRVKLAIPSLVKYSALINTAVRFGEGTEVFGEIFSNNGIRFDGLAHNLVQSAVSSYDDPDHGGKNEFGVHTHVSPTDPLPPSAVPARSDVFMVGRNFPVPAVDFQGITQDLATMRDTAVANGFFATSSGVYGYDVELLPNDTYKIYKITALVPPPSGCTNVSNQDGWGTWSIQSESIWKTGSMPTSGLMFFEDNVWVRGTINTARLTIAAGVFPDHQATRKSITVNNDLLYTNYNGDDTIALIAQNNFNVGLISEDVLRIDAALMAQNGRAGRFYYRPPNTSGGSDRCGPTVDRQKITLYGMVGSNLRYGFGYTDITGYQTREIIYDGNLLHAPPPDFPFASDGYEQILWEEVQ